MSRSEEFHAKTRRREEDREGFDHPSKNIWRSDIHSVRRL